MLNYDNYFDYDFYLDSYTYKTYVGFDDLKINNKNIIMNNSHTSYFLIQSFKYIQYDIDDKIDLNYVKKKDIEYYENFMNFMFYEESKIFEYNLKVFELAKYQQITNYDV